MDSGNLLLYAIPLLFGFAILLVVATAVTRRRAEGDGRPPDAAASGVEVTPRQVEAQLTREAKARYSEVERSLGGTGGSPATRSLGGILTLSEPPRPEELGVTRRQLFNKALVASQGLAYGGFGAAVLAFLWPSTSSGFGGKVLAGNLDEILSEIAEKRAPYYVPSARSYVVPYPKEALAKAKAVYPESLHPGLEAGVTALWQKCPHLGCRVPWCETSQWFECPCHGSKYNRVGEKKDGPAPRGMDHFPVEVDGGRVVINTGITVQGPTIGTNTTGQGAEGPACV